jgi:hypothetical protein
MSEYVKASSFLTFRVALTIPFFPWILVKDEDLRKFVVGGEISGGESFSIFSFSNQNFN